MDKIEIGKNWKHYDLIVQNGNVMEAKIQKGELEEGKLSTGSSLRKQVSFKILDKDYGKSAQLMRYIMEGEGGGSSKNLLLIGIIAVAGFLLLLFVIFSLVGGDKEPVGGDFIIPTKLTESQVQTDVFDRIEEDKRENVIVEEKEPVIIPVTESVQSPVFDMQNQFEIERLKVVVLQKDSEFDILNQKYQFEIQQSQKYLLEKQELESQNENYISKIRGLELKLIETEKNGDKTASDDFLIHLGEKVKESCENAVTEEKKSSCNSLYFKFIK